MCLLRSAGSVTSSVVECEHFAESLQGEGLPQLGDDILSHPPRPPGWTRAGHRWLNARTDIGGTAGAWPGCATYSPCTPHGSCTTPPGRRSDGPPTGPAPSHSACRSSTLDDATDFSPGCRVCPLNYRLAILIMVPCSRGRFGSKCRVGASGSTLRAVIFHDRRSGWWSGWCGEHLDCSPGVGHLIDPWPVRAQVQPPFAVGH